MLSEQLKSDLSNLMLLCDTHHRLIDKVDVQGHPVERLQEMKRKHEERMELLTSLNPEKQSHVLLYGAKVGAVDSFLNHKEASLGMVPDRYPATGTPLALSLQNASWNDRDSKFWEIEGPHLESIFGRDIEPRFRDGPKASFCWICSIRISVFLIKIPASPMRPRMALNPNGCWNKMSIGAAPINPRGPVMNIIIIVESERTCRTMTRRVIVG